MDAGVDVDETWSSWGGNMQRLDHCSVSALRSHRPLLEGLGSSGAQSGECRAVGGPRLECTCRCLAVEWKVETSNPEHVASKWAPPQ